MAEKMTIKHMLDDKNKHIETDVIFESFCVIFKFNNTFIWYQNIKYLETQPKLGPNEEFCKLIFRGNRKKVLYEIKFDNHDEMYELFMKLSHIIWPDNC